MSKKRKENKEVGEDNDLYQKKENCVYYFSGTGNSLKIAKDIADRIGNCDIRFIPDNMNKKDPLNYERVGFVFPVYAWGPPMIVDTFVKNLKPEGMDPYIFTVINYGGENGATLRYFSKSLKKKDLDLDAGFEVCMPINHIGRSDPEPEGIQKEKYERWNSMVSQITSTIKDQKYVGYEEASLFNRFFRTGIMHRIAARFFHKYDDNFTINDKCEGCGKCEEICPVDNVRLKNEEPEWHNECQLCLACLNWCPNEAIEYGDKSIGRKRYQNPEINHNEMLC